jgi:hypothetical protein
LVSIGKELKAMILTLAAVGLVAAACFIGVPSQAFGEAQLLLTATSASVALAIAMVVSFALVVREAGAFIPFPTFARVLLVIGVAWALGHQVPHLGKLLLIPAAIAIGIIYIAALFITRELKATDAAWAAGIFRRKRG